MVNMVGPMVAATAAPPSKKKPTARRPRIAISHTYRPFADGGMCSAYTCDQAHQAVRPTAQAIRKPADSRAAPGLRIGLYPTFTQSGVVSGCSGHEYGGIEYGGLPIFRDCSGATTDFVLL